MALDNNMTFKTSMTVMEIERKLDRAFRRIRVENIDQLASTAALSLAVSGRTAAFSPLIFEIHIMVWDTGYCRTIDMNAIGDDAGTFLRTSIRQEYGVYRELKTSKKKRDKLAKLLGLL